MFFFNLVSTFFNIADFALFTVLLLDEGSPKKPYAVIVLYLSGLGLGTKG